MAATTSLSRIGISNRETPLQDNTGPYRGLPPPSPPRNAGSIPPRQAPGVPPSRTLSPEGKSREPPFRQWFLARIFSAPAVDVRQQVSEARDGRVRLGGRERGNVGVGHQHGT